MKSAAPSKIVLYDGPCGLCNVVVSLLLKLDKHEHLTFASLQSDYARLEFKRRGRTTIPDDTIVVLADELLLQRSDALLKIMTTLPWPWKLLTVFRVVPRRLRDSVYRFVAKNRHRFFESGDACAVPDSKHRRRFLD